jgi:DNA mismatch repair protein MutL
MMQHKYPFTSLYFEIDPSGIDVNVHPQKMEIRLKNGEEIYKLTIQAIKDALSGREMIPKVLLTPQEEEKVETKGIPEPFEANRRKQEVNPVVGKPFIPEPVIQKTFQINYGEDKNPILITKVEEKSGEYQCTVNGGNKSTENSDNRSAEIKSAALPLEKKPVISDKPVIPQSVPTQQLNLFPDHAAITDAPFLSETAVQQHRIIGQIFSTYWLVEYKKELYIIDQHAAHEKVLYEKTIAAAKAKAYSSQQLLPPIVLSLSIREQEVLHRYEETLQSLGYEFEHFGGNEFSVRAVPADLYGISEKELLLEFIDDLADEITGNTSNTASILEKVASLSCKAAVKANHTLSKMEAEVQIKELLMLDNPYNCPHGRPVIISMSQYELERKFKRIV